MAKSLCLGSRSRPELQNIIPLYKVYKINKTYEATSTKMAKNPFGNK